MLFVANELWPLVAAAVWIALGVFIAGVAIVGEEREGPRRGAQPRGVRPRTVHGSGPLRAARTGTGVRRVGPCSAGQGTRARPARRFFFERASGSLFFERASGSRGMGPFLGRYF